MTDFSLVVVHILGVPLYLGDIVVWGGLGTTLLTMTMVVSRWLGLSRMSIPFMLGTIFTDDRRKATAMGLVFHTVNGWIIALLFAISFQRLGTATWWLGASFGVVEALFLLLVIAPALPAVHPRMATERHGPTAHRALEPPGFFALNYGSRTPLITLLAHAIYGAVLGGAFEIVVAAGT